MSQIKTLNGVQYTLPQYNDIGWGANTGNVLTQYMAAIADVTLQLTGGAFTLTAETDFGANFGLKALYLKSEGTNPSTTGVIRLANVEKVSWRNAGNSADLPVYVDSGNNLLYNNFLVSNGANAVLLAGLGSIVNADVNAAAAIAYSKLNLSNSVVNADINSAAAIAYSKLTLTGAVVNADISASAAIAYTKLAALTVSRAVATDAGGAITISATTAAELAFVNGVTSAIQTQLNGKQASGTYVNSVTGTANQITSSGGTTPVLSLPSPLTTPGSVTITGSLTFSPTTAGIVGTTTNDSAAAGRVGEIIQSQIGSGAPTSLVSGTPKNVTSISVTAGAWDIFGIAGFIPGGTISTLASASGVNSATIDNEQSTAFLSYSSSTPAVAAERLPFATASYSFASTTTVFLIARADFTVSCSAFGTITARRMR